MLFVIDKTDAQGEGCPCDFEQIRGQVTHRATEQIRGHVMHRPSIRFFGSCFLKDALRISLSSVVDTGDFSERACVGCPERPKLFYL